MNILEFLKKEGICSPEDWLETVARYSSKSGRNLFTRKPEQLRILASRISHTEWNFIGIKRGRLVRAVVGRSSLKRAFRPVSLAKTHITFVGVPMLTGLPGRFDLVVEKMPSNRIDRSSVTLSFWSDPETPLIKGWVDPEAKKIINEALEKKQPEKVYAGGMRFRMFRAELGIEASGYPDYETLSERISNTGKQYRTTCYSNFVALAFYRSGNGKLSAYARYTDADCSSIEEAVPPSIHCAMPAGAAAHLYNICLGMQGGVERDQEPYLVSHTGRRSRYSSIDSLVIADVRAEGIEGADEKALKAQDAEYALKGGAASLDRSGGYDTRLGHRLVINDYRVITP